MNSDKQKRLKLLVIGIKWPPETFIYNLIEKLSPAIEVTVAGYIASVRLSQSSKCKPFRLIHLISGKEGVLKIIYILLRNLAVNLLKNPVKLYRFWRRTSHHRYFLSKAYFFLSKVLPLIPESPDIIHFPWNSQAIVYLPFFELFKAKIVISCRGSQIGIAPHNPERLGFSEGLRITFEKADAVHCVSNFTMQEAQKYGLDKKKAWVIRPAVDTNFFHPQPRNQMAKGNTVQIVTVGFLWWRKGYEYALSAIKKLVDKGYDIKFKIVSSKTVGKESKFKMLYTIEDMRLDDFVYLYGKMSPDGVRKMLWESDIFLLSSLSEGISNAALEAMSCGLPVVSTDCGGMREAITDGVEGFIVPVRDPDAMAMALGKLVEDPQLRKQMGLAARERVIRYFTLENQVKEFILLYNSLI